MNPLRSLSIRAKLLLGLGGMVFAVMVFVGAYYPARFTDEFISHLIAETEATADLLAFNASPATEFGDIDGAKKSIGGARRLADVQYIGVFDKDGKPLAEDGRRTGDPPKGTAQGTSATLRGHRLIVRRTIDGIGGNPIGVLMIERSLGRVDRKRIEDIRATAVVGAIILAFALSIAFLMMRFISRPVVAVTRGVQRIAEGDLNAPEVRVPSRDEIGQLAQSFNLMRERLRSTTVSKDFLDKILTSMADMLFVLDLEGRIETANRAAQTVLGLPEDQLARVRFDELVTDGPPGLQRQLSGLAGELASIDLTLRASDDSPVPVTVSSSTIIDHQQQIEGIVLVARDMRETRRAIVAEATAEVERTKAAELETFNRELTAAQEALKDATREAMAARDAAEAATRSKSEFLANMSHEIRTPMNGVIGMVEVLMGTTISPVQRRHLETIRSSGNTLLAIINDILDFSKVEAGHLELEVTEFNLHHAVEDVISLHGPRARSAGLNLIKIVDTRVPRWAKGDVTRVRQVLTNLVGNSLKFTQEGRVAVRVTVAEQDEETALVRFEVEDTGIGLSPADAERLFEPFSQADSSTTRRFGGTGLGLAICKSLVALMGGKLGVWGKPGEGSTFWFTIPLQPQPDRDSREALALSDLANQRVLFVDSNRTRREALAGTAETLGIAVEQAHDGFDALRRLRQALRKGRLPGAAVIDLRLDGGMDGQALGRLLSESDELDQIALVLASSTPHPGQAREAEEAGFAGYLTRPIADEDLADCLRVVLATPTGEAGSRGVITRHLLAEGRRKPRILLVEDDPINQEVAAHLLGQLGCEVSLAATGLEAVAAADDGYDVILMDCQMPELDGFEATARIRQQQGERHTPIVALTAHAMTGDRQRCIDAGMDDYLTKPVVPADLHATLSRWLTELPPAAELPEGAAQRDTGAADDDGNDDAASEPVSQAELAKLRKAIGKNADKTIKQLIEMYLEADEEGGRQIAEAHERGDIQTILEVTHRLKSSSALVGAMGLSATYLALEKKSRAKELISAEELAKLRRVRAKVTAALADERDRLG